MTYGAVQVIKKPDNDGMETSYVSFDAAGRLTAFSGEAFDVIADEEMLGRYEGKLLGDVIENFYRIEGVAPVRPEIIAPLVEQWRRAGALLTAESHAGANFLLSNHQTPDGGRCYVAIEVKSPVSVPPDHGARASRITAENNLDAQALLHGAIQSLSEGIGLWDNNMRLVTCNSAYADYTGVPLDRYRPGVHFNDMALVSAQSGKFVDAAGREEEFAKSLIGLRKSFAKDIEGLMADGRWINISCHRTDLGGALLIVQDVSERRHSRDLAVSVLNDAVDALDMGLVLYDADLNFVFGNQKLMEFFYGDIAPPTSGENAIDTLRRQVDANIYVDIEGRSDIDHVARIIQMMRNFEKNVEIRTRDGNIFIASAHPTQLDGCLVSFSDITESARIESELEKQREIAHQNEKLSAMGELLAGVAHELNNPLSIVVGYAQLLKGKAGDVQTQRRIDRIGLAAERSAKIVKTFLAMARQRPAALQRCSLNEIVTAALDIAGQKLRAAGATVTLDLDADLPDVSADEDQMIQVMTNLILNAEHAMKGREGQRLEIRSYSSGTAGRIAVSFTDNGAGIADDVLPRIFEPFFTTKDVGEGTGFGLAFCHRTMKAHGGDIEARSVPGEGAEFTIYLNAAQKPSEGRVNVDVQSVTSGNGRVLVLDDETDVAQLIADLLIAAGYEVECCSDAYAALDRAKSGEFDAILSDYKMPGLDGAGLFSLLHDHDQDLARRVGFITGDTLSAHVAKFLTTSKRPYMEKPVDPTVLPGFVARLISMGKGKA